MIELQKVKRDVINYGALKVYTTFLTISEEEVDPELFAASQLKEIFEKKYDVLKINISFVEGEPAEVVGTELLVFKLSKCSDNEISYMSNVDDEGKLSSLVLTKSGDEVSLEVNEYEIGGEGHTDEEIKELAVGAVEESPSGTIVDALGLDEDGKVVKGSLPSGGTKLYKHQLDLDSGRNCTFISTESESSNVNNIVSTIKATGIVPTIAISLISVGSGIVLTGLYDDQGTIKSAETPPLSIISDTVTEL